MVEDERYDHVAMHISWDEVAKYVVDDAATADACATLIEEHPSRFLLARLPQLDRVFA